MREPLIVPLAAIASGVLLARVVPFSPTEAFFLIATFAILALLSYKSRALAIACCTIGFVLSGVLVALAHTAPPAPELDAANGESVILSGCVVEPAVLGRDREQFTLELAPGARARVNWYLRQNETPPALNYGDRVEFPAKTRQPHNFRNPGAFDYTHFLARQQIFWTASTPAGAQADRLPGQCGSPFWRAIYNLRTAALTRIETLYEGSAYNIAMMQAILIGETAAMERLWTEDYRVTGTFHALVISGSHVALLAGVFLFLLRVCFVPRRYAVPATVLAAWLYCFVTGWQAPVIRSAAGMTLFAFGTFFHRKPRMLNILAAVALIFLAADPESLFDPSFQLSFLSVALIAVFVVPLIDRTSGPLAAGLPGLSDPERDLHLTPLTAQFRIELRLIAQTFRLLFPPLPQKLALFCISLVVRLSFYFYELLLTSAIIQIGLALPMALYFHRISFTGLSANAIIVPLLGLVVPIGFFSLFAQSCTIASLAAWILDLSRLTAQFHARWEPAWRIPNPPVWLSLAFVLAVVLAAIRFPRNWVRFAAGALALAFLALIVWHPFAPLAKPGSLEVTVIDVGQGDSLLIAFPDGKLMLMDGGGIAAFGRKAKTRLEIGEDVVAPYLWTRGIKRLDVVALSHAHEDHIGGLAAILRDFEVQELWTGATPHSESWDNLAAQAEARHTTIRPLRRSEAFPFGGATVQVLAPGPEYQPGPTPKNNDSLVLRLAHGRHSFLLTGDMEKQIEQQLVADGIAHADVLKAGHHGSKSSSTAPFLDAVHPAFALISDGVDNSYGHPHPLTLEHLAERHIETFRTDRQGLITIRSDGRYLEVPPP